MINYRDFINLVYGVDLKQSKVPKAEPVQTVDAGEMRKIVAGILVKLQKRKMFSVLELFISL